MRDGRTKKRRLLWWLRRRRAVVRASCSQTSRSGGNGAGSLRESWRRKAVWGMIGSRCSKPARVGRKAGRLGSWQTRSGWRRRTWSAKVSVPAGSVQSASHSRAVSSRRLPQSTDQKFAGTRVPVKVLMDHLAARDSLDEILEDFPGVSCSRPLPTCRWPARPQRVPLSKTARSGVGLRHRGRRRR